MESFILLILAVITALYAGVILWARLGIEKGGESADAEYQPFVSVIVAARNEEQKLPGLMEALMAQTYPMDRLEVIVVDDGSTDKTGDVLKDYKEQWPQLQSLRVDVTPRGWSPKKWALSQGVERANGEIIFTTDADCVPGPGWVWELSRPFRASDVAMAFGSAHLINPAAGWWWKALRLDSNTVTMPLLPDRRSKEWPSAVMAGTSLSAGKFSWRWEDTAESSTSFPETTICSCIKWLPLPATGSCSLPRQGPG